MNEITAIADPSLTLTATLVLGATVQISGIALMETTVPGFYAGSMPATPAGAYTVLVISAGVIVSGGLINWDGSAEALLPVNLTQVRGQQINGGGTPDNPWGP
jgi:hypothetical protein